MSGEVWREGDTTYVALPTGLQLITTQPQPLEGRTGIQGQPGSAGASIIFSADWQEGVAYPPGRFVHYRHPLYGGPAGGTGGGYVSRTTTTPNVPPAGHPDSEAQWGPVVLPLPGVPGPPGSGALGGEIHAAGTWEAGTLYKIGAVVRRTGGLSVAMNEHTSTASGADGPPTSSAAVNWAVFLEDGINGTPGADSDKRGPRGQGFRFRGSHQNGNSYEAYDVVRHNKRGWLCTSDTGSAPSNGNDKWDLLWVDGENGEKGEDGRSLRFRGQYEEGTTYQRDDLARSGTVVWFAERETTDAPGDSPDWSVYLRDGNDGVSNIPGPPGQGAYHHITFVGSEDFAGSDFPPLAGPKPYGVLWLGAEILFNGITDMEVEVRVSGELKNTIGLGNPWETFTQASNQRLELNCTSVEGNGTWSLTLWGKQLSS